MKSELAAEIRRLGGDVGDDVWRWFVENGPHGSGFTWSQTRKEPPGYVGVEHLQRIVAEKEEIDSGFPVRARAIVGRALQSNHTSILRRAIQVAAVVGDEATLRSVSALTGHENEAIAGDARASVFYLRRRLGGKRE